MCLNCTSGPATSFLLTQQFDPTVLITRPSESHECQSQTSSIPSVDSRIPLDLCNGLLVELVA